MIIFFFPKVLYFMYRDILLVEFLRTLQSLMWKLGNLPSYNHVHNTHFLFICASIHHLHKESVCILWRSHFIKSPWEATERIQVWQLFSLDIISLRASSVSKINTSFVWLWISMQCSPMIQGSIKQSKIAIWSPSFGYSLLLLLSSLIAL